MNELLNNSYGIDEISFETNIKAYCPLGGDYYNAQINVTITPGDTLFDYCEADRFIKSLEDESMIIERLVEIIFNYFKEYAEALTVTVHAVSETHFPVSVTKKM